MHVSHAPPVHCSSFQSTYTKLMASVATRGSCIFQNTSQARLRAQPRGSGQTEPC